MANASNELEEMIKELKKNPGFKSYIILNNDGIVIKWDQPTPSSAPTTAAAVAGGAAPAAGGAPAPGAPAPSSGNEQGLTYLKAVHHAHQVLGLCAKAKHYIRELRELIPPPDNEVENIRLRTDDHELIAAQYGNFTLIVTQEDATKIRPVSNEEVVEAV
jgi:predicted regulator of Ras-like GTPase activity (Roadblock/LC7/MglB family)